MLVGLYILMGMGLNLEVGLAGLLDLGFVAFFAVGAYTTAILTADSPHALAVYTSLPEPLLLGGDADRGLCIRHRRRAVRHSGARACAATTSRSRPWASARSCGSSCNRMPRHRCSRARREFCKSRSRASAASSSPTPSTLFYLTLVCAGIAAYFAWRLENSRLGRAWMAVRDDEDVAQALGINLVKVKLLAYGLGAAFAGLARLDLRGDADLDLSEQLPAPDLDQRARPHHRRRHGQPAGCHRRRSSRSSACPSCCVNSARYRYLFYGVALIVMMRIQPEGLWPSATRRRELRAAAEGADPERRACPFDRRPWRRWKRRQGNRRSRCPTPPPSSAPTSSPCASAD